jgi:RsiW-degrading membrane proteinase PrsW (M82 family)
MLITVSPNSGAGMVQVTGCTTVAGVLIVSLTSPWPNNTALQVLTWNSSNSNCNVGNFSQVIVLRQYGDACETRSVTAAVKSANGLAVLLADSNSCQKTQGWKILVGTVVGGTVLLLVIVAVLLVIARKRGKLPWLFRHKEKNIAVGL